MSEFLKGSAWFFLNFFGLYLGSFATTPGVTSLWYASLNQAPWTTPGFVFGLAWSTIMIAFSLYLYRLSLHQKNSKALMRWFPIAWLLNVAWNPVFFGLHQTLLGLLILIALLVTVTYMAKLFFKDQKAYTLLLAPYILWLIVAASLNAYIVLFNPA